MVNYVKRRAMKAQMREKDHLYFFFSLFPQLLYFWGK